MTLSPKLVHKNDKQPQHDTWPRSNQSKHGPASNPAPCTHAYKHYSVFRDSSAFFCEKLLTSLQSRLLATKLTPILRSLNFQVASADRKAQIRKAFVQLSGVICALRSADFLRQGLLPRTTSRTISFSTSNSFWHKYCCSPCSLSFLVKLRAQFSEAGDLN